MSRNFSINQNIMIQVKEMLELMGVPYLICPPEMEGEAYCSALTSHGISIASCSEDSDTCLFSDDRVLSVSHGKPWASLLEEIDISRARFDMGLTRDEFLDFCILCGSDFSSTIQGIGPVKALSLIKTHGSIEGILKKIPNIPYPGFDYLQARKVFNSSIKLPKTFDVSLKRRPMNRQGIVTFFKNLGYYKGMIRGGEVSGWDDVDSSLDSISMYNSTMRRT